jgi:hypothetical protein
VRFDARSLPSRSGPGIEPGRADEEDGRVGPKPRPPVHDIAAVLEHVGLHGFIDYPAHDLLADFPRWRREVRARAAHEGHDLSVMHLGDVVVVHDPHHELAADVGRAVADVIDSLMTEGAAATTFSQALYRQRRRRIGIARD